MKCLIVDLMHESTSALFKEVGLEVDYKPQIKRDEILSVISDYEGLVIRSKTPVDAELIDAAKRLKFVGRAGAGVDNLDVEKLAERSVEILNAPEGNKNALAEHTVGLLLSLLHRIVKGNREVKAGIWDREGNRGIELEGKTVGLLGYGHMGEAFARKLKVFNCKVLAYDKYKEGFSDENCQEASLEDIFEKSDIFSIHVPLTAETRGMVDHTFFKAFEKPIYLLNTARGEILDLEACCMGLESGIIMGAGLDVLENEKIEKLNATQQKSFDYLAKSDQTIMTPHVSGWSVESYENISKVLASKIKSFLTQVG